MQWDYYRDLNPPMSWRFWDSHKNDAKFWAKKNVSLNINRGIRQETRTDMESATYEALEATVTFLCCDFRDVIKSMKRYVSTTMLVTLPDSPFRAAQIQHDKTWTYERNKTDLVSATFDNNDVTAAVDLCLAHCHNKTKIWNLDLSYDTSRSMIYCKFYQRNSIKKWQIL